MKRIINKVLSILVGVLNKYFFYFIVVIFISNFIFFLLLGYLDIFSLIFSLLIMCLLGFYKVLLENIIMNHKIEDIQGWFLVKMFTKLNEKVLRKNKWLIKPIYYILYYFPTNGLYLIVVWIGRKWWDIRIYINSNKDIIGKKYFKTNLSQLKSPVNNKYFNFFKKYVYDIFFKILYIFLYFKFNLITKEWDKFFKYRIFGVIYSTVLVINNLHIFVLFRNTEAISYWQKIIIVVFLMYIFLYFFSNVVNLIIENVSLQDSLALMKEINEKKILNKKDKEVKKRIKNILWFDLSFFLEELTISRYYYIKEFLIFMSLAERYNLFIDQHYCGYLSKNINKSNVNLPYNLIRLGCFSGFLQRGGFFDFYNMFFDKSVFNGSMLNVYWICEKNYRISFFFYTFLVKHDFYDQYIGHLKNYEIYKTFYGEKLVEEYFKDELEEFESLCYIYINWMLWLFGDLKLIDTLIKLSKKEIYDDIPLKICNNLEYKEVLYLSNFFIYYKIPLFNWMNYDNYFDFELVKNINNISKDVFKFKSNYNKDLNMFIEFWSKKTNQLIDDDPLMKFRIEIFLKHDNNVNFKLKKIKGSANKFYKNIEDKSVNNMIKIIRELQEEHKKKYFLKKPILNKSYDFLEKHAMKEEWKYFDKKNKDMFF